MVLPPVLPPQAGCVRDLETVFEICRTISIRIPPFGNVVLPCLYGLCCMYLKFAGILIRIVRIIIINTDDPRCCGITP